MKKTIILSYQSYAGDTSMKLSWDPDNPESVEKQKKIFQHLKKQGYIFFKVKYTPEGYEHKGDIVNEFSPELKKLLADIDTSELEIEELERKDDNDTLEGDLIDPETEELEDGEEVHGAPMPSGG